MPTLKQHFKLDEFRLRSGLSDEEFYCTDFSQEPITDRNHKPSPSVQKFSGPVRGRVIYDKEKEELHIIPNYIYRKKKD